MDNPILNIISAAVGKFTYNNVQVEYKFETKQIDAENILNQIEIPSGAKKVILTIEKRYNLKVEFR